MLGCGEWRAVLQCRGGGVLTELPVESLGMGRRLDDMSEASVIVSGASFDGWTAADRERCCGHIASINPWEHELALWRGDHEAWVGPVVQPAWGVSSVRIGARDLFQWFERRLLETDRDFAGADLGAIAYRLMLDALRRDPTAAIEFTEAVAGITGDRTVVAAARRRAADELRELFRSGLDFTAYGRRLLMGAEVPTPAIGPLLVEHFAEPGPVDTLDGLDAATESTMIGARGPSGEPLIAVAGGIDEEFGLLQDVATESGIEDETSLQAAAQTRHDMLGTAPDYVAGNLIAEAPVDFADLVPGARADLRLALFCREVVGDYRLQEVRVTVSASGDVVDETVGVQFVTLGTVAA